MSRNCQKKHHHYLKNVTIYCLAVIILSYLQVRVIARDGGTPPRSDITVVDVTVIRNLARPRFDPTAYTTRIIETLPLGEPIIAVRATDDDARVLYLFTLCSSNQHI